MSSPLYVVTRGSSTVGPFPTRDEALAWVEARGDGDVVRVNPPESRDTAAARRRAELRAKFVDASARVVDAVDAVAAAVQVLHACGDAPRTPALNGVRVAWGRHLEEFSALRSVYLDIMREAKP